ELGSAGMLRTRRATLAVVGPSREPNTVLVLQAGQRIRKGEGGRGARRAAVDLRGFGVEIRPALAVWKRDPGQVVRGRGCARIVVLEVIDAAGWVGHRGEAPVYFVGVT